MEIGIDLESNNRFKDISEHFKERVFANEELAYAYSKPEPHIHLCVFWCVKEAFVKATNSKNVSFKDIKVLHEENGNPYLELNNKIKKILQNLNLTEVKISLSHTNEFSTAVVLVC